MSATINGTPVNFGFFGNDSGITVTSVTGLTGSLLQTAEQSKGADNESARNGTGDKVTNGWYDIHDEATLEFVVAHSSSQASARAATSLSALSPGAFVVVPSAGCPSRPDLVGTWEVQANARIVGGNTNMARISVPLHKRSGITAAAGA